ncbi:MAG: pseudouridine synthase [Planctomycetota bacterium]
MAKRPSSRHVSLARALSKLGFASRTEAAELITNGGVTVNARVITDPNAWVDLARAKIEVKNRRVEAAELIYFMMNKPAGLITTRSDELGRPTVYDLLPPDSRAVSPVGRLDKDTSGLLIFTNDHAFANGLTAPGSIEKLYHVAVDRPLDDAAVRAFQKPMTLGDGTQLKPAAISNLSVSKCEFDITIREGKNRQIRRACEFLGYIVKTLARRSIGPLRLGALAEGETRPLTIREVTELRAAAGRPHLKKLLPRRQL